MTPSPVSAAPLTVTTINTLLSKSEGRDKVARFFQYLMRTIIGVAGMQTLTAGTTLYSLNEKSGNVMKQLASARRAHRWCKEFPVIQAILKSLPRSIPETIRIGDVLEGSTEVMQKVFLATFMICDHVGWLKQVKIMKGGKRAGTGTIQLGLKFFCASNVLGALVTLKKLKDAPEGQESKTKKLKETLLKNFLIVLQTLHLSRTYELHDAAVGVMGMVTSAMDVKTQWPEQK